MGLGSILGKIAGVAAAPFTGGASLIPTILGGVGQVAGAMSGGRAAGRQAEDQANLERLLLQNRLFQDQAGLDLDRKSFAMDAPQRRMSQVMLADLLQNIQPLKVKVPGIPDYEISGGFNPGMFTDFARKAAGEFGRQANDALFAKSDQDFVGVENPDDLAAQHKFDTLTKGAQAFAGRRGLGIKDIGANIQKSVDKMGPRPTVRKGMPSLTLPAAPSPGKLDSFLNILGSAGQLGSAFMPPARNAPGVTRRPTTTSARANPAGVTIGPGVRF